MEFGEDSRAEDEEPTSAILDWVRKNVWNLFATVIIVASAYGAMKVENQWRDEKITYNKSELEKAQLRIEVNEKGQAELKFREDINTVRIESLTSDQKSAQKDISDIKAQLGVLTNKLDTAIEILKHLQDRGGSK